MPALETPPLNPAWKAVDFHLKGTDGRFYSLNEVRGSRGLLVMFICNHCPFVQAIADKIARDAFELMKIGVGCVAIMSNDTDEYPEDSLDNMKKFKEKHNFTFPYLIDETQQVARAYEAVCTPDFFGFDSDLTLRYRCRLDDSGTKNKEGSKRELFEAMSEIINSGRGPTLQKPSIGCSIKWRTVQK